MSDWHLPFRDRISFFRLGRSNKPQYPYDLCRTGASSSCPSKPSRFGQRCLPPPPRSSQTHIITTPPCLTAEPPAECRQHYLHPPAKQAVAPSRSAEPWDQHAAVPDTSRQQLFRAATHPPTLWLLAATSHPAQDQRETSGRHRERFAVKLRIHHTMRGSLNTVELCCGSHSIEKPFSKDKAKPLGRCTLPAHLSQPAVLLLLFISTLQMAQA